MPDLIKLAQIGALKSHYDIRDYKGKTDYNEENLPKEFSLDVSKLPVAFQVGSTCVANSLAKAVELFNIRETGEYKPMSVGFIYGNRDSVDETYEGMYVNKALNRLQKYGTVPYEDYPYERAATVEVPAVLKVLDELKAKAEPYKINEYYRVRTRDEIKAALYSGHPVIFVVEWGANNYVQQTVDGRNKDYLMLNSPYDSLHAMIIYGWDNEGWLIQNSHGSWWAGDGRTILPFDAFLVEAWGIVDFNNTAEQAIRIEYPNIPKVVAKAINKFMNLFYK